MEQAQIDVSILIVNYNTKYITYDCLASIYASVKNVSYEIILVDNASSDGSVEYIEEKFPEVKTIHNEYNKGFGPANNIGAKYAKGKYLLLLNSDTILEENALLKMFKYMERHEEIVACGCSLLDANRMPAISHGNLPSLKMEFADLGFFHLYSNFYKHRLSSHQKYNEGNIEDVGYICGADIFIRKEIFDILGGFDEDFFMYYEETDLFRRLKGMGYMSVILPDTHIVHLEGASQNKEYSIKRFDMYNKSRFMYYRKAGYNEFQIWMLKVLCFFYLTTRISKWNGHYKEMCKLLIGY